MGALSTVCPAAEAVHPPTDEPSVICGVLKIANDGAEIRGFTHQAEVDPLMSGRTMATTVHNFCAGSGLPGSVCSYTACAIWKADKARIAARRHSGVSGLRDEQATRAPMIDPELQEFVSLSRGG